MKKTLNIISQTKMILSIFMEQLESSQLILMIQFKLRLIIDEVDDEMGEVDDDQKKIDALIEIIHQVIMMAYVRMNLTM